MTEWFAIPDGQSIVYAYQTLISAILALFAAGIAYFAAVHSADASAKRIRLSVLDECCFIAHDVLVKAISAKRFIQNDPSFAFEIMCKEIKDIRMSVFEIEYTSVFTDLPLGTILKFRNRISFAKEYVEKEIELISKRKLENNLEVNDFLDSAERIYKRMMEIAEYTTRLENMKSPNSYYFKTGLKVLWNKLKIK